MKTLRFGNLIRHRLRYTGTPWIVEAGIALHVPQQVLGHQAIDTPPTATSAPNTTTSPRQPGRPTSSSSPRPPERAPAAATHRAYERSEPTLRPDEQRVSVVRRYEAGDASTALANDYGVAKSTILFILRASDVEVRRQPMTSVQVSEASHLYKSVPSLSQVADRLKVNQETMRLALLTVGVKLRSPTGSKER